MNVKFKTSAESWLVTMTMVATSDAPKARSLSKREKIVLVFVMEIISFNESSEEEDGSSLGRS